MASISKKPRTRHAKCKELREKKNNHNLSSESSKVCQLKETGRTLNGSDKDNSEQIQLVDQNENRTKSGNQDLPLDEPDNCPQNRRIKPRYAPLAIYDEDDLDDTSKQDAHSEPPPKYTCPQMIFPIYLSIAFLIDFGSDFWLAYMYYKGRLSQNQLFL